MSDDSDSDALSLPQRHSLDNPVEHRRPAHESRLEMLRRSERRCSLEERRPLSARITPPRQLYFFEIFTFLQRQKHFLDLTTCGKIIYSRHRRIYLDESWISIKINKWIKYSGQIWTLCGADSAMTSTLWTSSSALSAKYVFYKLISLR